MPQSARLEQLAREAEEAAVAAAAEAGRAAAVAEAAVDRRVLAAVATVWVAGLRRHSAAGRGPRDLVWQLGRLAANG